MRRSGSSSCMLRPKDSCTDDEGDVTLSVTLLNKEQLPSYSVERFYMLSEIDHHVHSTQFLCDLNSAARSLGLPPTTEEGTPLVNGLPPYCILYLLWKHDATTSPKAFCEDVVCKALEKLQKLVDIEPSCKSPSRSSSGSERDSPPSEFETTRKKMRVYLVVDRCVPDQQQLLQQITEPQHLSVKANLTSEEMEASRNRRYQVQVDLAEKLARTVATNPVARSICEGITVGVADHIRAAPGLEACLNGISFGASDRRRAFVSRSGTSTSNSSVGIITDVPNDLLGLQGAETEPDAAEGVLQCRIVAEWSGRGNLLSFARRAHSEWRKVYMPNDIDSFHGGVVDLNQLSCDKFTVVDFLSSTAAFLFWVVVLVCLWHTYGDSFPIAWSSSTSS